MPKVYTADIRNLLDQAIQRFELESGLKAAANYPLFFHALVSDINREANTSLKADTLYKHFYLRLRTFDETMIGYSWVYLDALATFVHSQAYREVNPVFKNSVNEIRAAVKRVDFDIGKGSEDDPSKPEFPPNNPSFPATPTVPIRVKGFSNVWLKDESYNPTGTHKDRMAWEIIIFYRNFLADFAKRGRLEKIPQLSLISSGCAAVAIQSQLRYYNLPSLKVIVDKKLEESIKLAMMRLGCEIYEEDLSQRQLDPQAILAITENENGYDLTFGAELNYIRGVYYDWLGYEILNQSPDYCFIPFGSGGLCDNIFSICQREIKNAPAHSRRFFGNIERLKNCHFIGATTSLPHSSMDKLYSPFSPQEKFQSQIQGYVQQGLCGEHSGIEEVEEHFVEKALSIAQAENIQCEPSGIAGLALLLQKRSEIPADKKILVINTGRLRLEKFLSV